MPSPLSPLTILGDQGQGGTYILRMQIRQPLLMPFGGFKRGKLIAVPAGECVYVGSALGQRGALSLGRRLVRHATRTEPHPPHPIRQQLLAHFAASGLGAGDLLPKRPKRRHWNVDHLLDQAEVALSHLIAIRSPQRLEGEIAHWLEHDPHTFILENGLGANDMPGNTHLLGVQADEAWWRALPDVLRMMI